jgi:hypothetical protein
MNNLFHKKALLHPDQYCVSELKFISEGKNF